MNFFFRHIVWFLFRKWFLEKIIYKNLQFWTILIPISHQFILSTQGNPLNFRKKHWELGELKFSVFLSRPFWFFFFCFIPIKISHKLTGYHGWDSIFMIIMISRKKLGGYRIMNYETHCTYVTYVTLHIVEFHVYES